MIGLTDLEKRWRGEEKPGRAKVKPPIRKLFSDVSRTLYTNSGKVRKYSLSIKEKEKKALKELVTSVESETPETPSILASNISDYRKTYRMLDTLSANIEGLAMRLDSLVALGDAATALSVASRHTKQIKEGVKILSTASQELDRLIEDTSKLMGLGLLYEGPGGVLLDEDAEKVLREAEEIAKNRMKI